MKKIKGMIFAAGLGTRLYPLTADRPKALVKIQNATLLEHAIYKLKDAEIDEIVVNIHHFSKMMREFIENNDFGVKISLSDESVKLLDTAGGLKFASPLLQDAEHILLYNVDVISNINLQQMFTYHLQNDSLATLAVRNRATSRYFIFDDDTKQLCGWTNHATKEKIITTPSYKEVELAFSGIHIVKNQLLSLIPNTEKQSLTQLYLTLAKEHKIIAYDHTDDTWQDVGKYDDLKNKE